MAQHGCGIDGSLNQQGFTKPLPVIGIYIAIASLVCLFFISLDTLSAIRCRKHWFPNRFFTLDATYLTLLSVATKFAVDLNTPMPGRVDQLSKLSSTVLICTVIGNFMPSVGNMNESEILSNFIALAILVITVTVNVCIQMGTGVIYIFLPEHAIIVFLMLILLVILGFSALIVPTTRQILNKQYDLKYPHVTERRNLTKNEGKIGEELDKTENLGLEHLKKQVEKFWMMAHTCSPQYVFGRSASCTAAGAFCLLAALILIEAAVRSFVKFESLRFCNGKSDYGWSTSLVFVSQCLLVVVGSVAPVWRWLSAINLKSGNWSCREEFNVEKYWVQRLEEWKKNPFPFDNYSRLVRMIVESSKNSILDVVIGTQRLVVRVSKFVRLISILLVGLVGKLYISSSSHCKRLSRKFASSLRLLGSYNHDVESMNGPSNEKQLHRLSHFVLHLEGEQGLVRWISRSGREDAARWIQRGKENCPKHLMKLLDKSTYGFKGIPEFDSDMVPLIPDTGSEIPQNCWALPIVTLASIAVSLSHLNEERTKLLLRGVSEGMKFVKFIEKNLDDRGLINMRDAAELVWLRVDLYYFWLDVNLHSLGANGGACETPPLEEMIEKLAVIGENRVLECKERIEDNQPHQWPIEALAANSLYRLCKTILLDPIKYRTVEELFNWLEQTISDILGACLSNLPRAIFVECSCAYVEDREGRVRNAAYILGEAENFQQILRWSALEKPGYDELAYVDTWRCDKLENPPSLACTSDDNVSIADTVELSINVDLEAVTPAYENGSHWQCHP